MTKKQELEKVKKIIKERINNGDCGLFDTRNIVGDYMATIFKGKYFTLDICFNYSYFEVFGTTKEEFDELYDFYDDLRERLWEE